MLQPSFTPALSTPTVQESFITPSPLRPRNATRDFDKWPPYNHMNVAEQCIMAGNELLKPTLHVEVLLEVATPGRLVYKELCEAVEVRLRFNYDTVTVGQVVDGFGGIDHDKLLQRVEIVDYTGPHNKTGYYDLSNTELDVQAYALKAEEVGKDRRSIKQIDGLDIPQARTLELPNTTLNSEWSSLVFDDALPARLLRYLASMVTMMGQPGLDISMFNWNRLCLLHGPPGSGKSTLCRALAQKLSIRLRNFFERAVLVEINTNAMLSKYFGESGKLIGATFERIYNLAQDRSMLVCVMMDEVETVACSRTKAMVGNECGDGLRATNQLLTALDRLRNMPNVIVMCTSNLIDAIDAALLDRFDIKQLIPAPSPEAIYNIFRSCLNELVRSSLVADAAIPSQATDLTPSKLPSSPATLSAEDETPHPTQNPSTTTSDGSWSIVSLPSPIPTFSEMQVRYQNDYASLADRLWALAQRCHGLSGRTLRRLPILGLAMYTWGGECSLSEAVSALEAAVEQELLVSGRGFGHAMDVGGD